MTRPNSKKKAGRRLPNILVPALLIFIAALVWRFQAAGLFNLFTHYPQTLRGGFTRCEKIYSEAIGAEDAAVLSHDPPLVILSAAPHKSMMGPRVEPGGIYLLDVSSRKVTRIELVGINSSIHPHGISLYHDKESGQVFLFVVNHQDVGSPDQVLIFEYDQQKNELIFKEKVEDEKLISLNDVAGVGPREFYATNDNGYPRGSVNNFLSVVVPWLAKSSVVHWNGRQTSWAAEPGSFIMANGIAKSTCNSKIYVADTTNSGSLRVFNRWDDGALQEIQSLALKTGIDNIDVNPDGTIWIGSHPNLLRFITHAALDWPGPSQAISVVLHDTTPVVTEVYLSNGDAEIDISASSTALKVANYLLITPVFDAHILLCS